MTEQRVIAPAPVKGGPLQQVNGAGDEPGRRGQIVRAATAVLARQARAAASGQTIKEVSLPHSPYAVAAYYVVATGSGGTSGYAGISATTLKPQPPVNLRVIGLTSTTITLAWDPSPGPVPAAITARSGEAKM